MQLGLGAALVVFAGPLGHSLAFYYASGSLLSVLAVGLIVAVLLLREVNRRTSTFWTLVTGSLTSLTGFYSWKQLIPGVDADLMWDVLLWRLDQSHYSAIFYGLVLLSFVLLYWYGPPQPRTLDTLTLVFKLVGAACIATALTDMKAGITLAAIVLALSHQLWQSDEEAAAAATAAGDTRDVASPLPAKTPLASPEPPLATPAPPSQGGAPAEGRRTPSSSGILQRMKHFSPWRSPPKAHPQLVEDLRANILGTPPTERLRISRKIPKQHRDAFKRLLDGDVLYDHEFDDIAEVCDSVMDLAEMLSDSDSERQSRRSSRRTSLRKSKKGKGRSSQGRRRSSTAQQQPSPVPYRVAGEQLLSDDEVAPPAKSRGARQRSASPPDERSEEEARDDDETTSTEDEAAQPQAAAEEDSASASGSDSEGSATESEGAPPQRHLILRALRTSQDRHVATASATHMTLRTPEERHSPEALAPLRASEERQKKPRAHMTLRTSEERHAHVSKVEAC